MLCYAMLCYAMLCYAMGRETQNARIRNGVVGFLSGYACPHGNQRGGAAKVDKDRRLCYPRDASTLSSSRRTPLAKHGSLPRLDNSRKRNVFVALPLPLESPPWSLFNRLPRYHADRDIYLFIHPPATPHEERERE